MGLLGRLIDVGTSIIPGPLDDIAVGAARAGVRRLRSGSSGRDPQRRTQRGNGSGPRRSSLVPQQSDPGLPDFGVDFGPFRIDERGVSPDPFDIGPFRFGADDPQPDTQNGTATMPGMNGQSGGFGSNMAMELLMQSIGDSSTGRALMEAITSGSLQRGVIQRTRTVQTPRGTENHSPPGFRTVYVNDQPHAVFKPLAQALGLLPSGERTHREKLDDAAREYLKRRREFKDLAPKLGLKTSDRKSGPKR